MALAARCKPSVAARPASRRQAVRVACHKGFLEQVQVAAATAVTAALLASPANAGVVLQQPELKKVFQSDAPAPAPVKREFKGLGAPAAPKPAAEKAAEAPKAAPASVSEQGTDLDPRSIALPGALVLVVGGFFAASKIDGGFDDFMTAAVVKDSADLGAGYEPVLKTDGGVVVPKGTKKVKATASGSKKGPSFFGKN